MKPTCIRCGRRAGVFAAQNLISDKWMWSCDLCGKLWRPATDETEPSEAYAQRKESAVTVPCSGEAWLKIQGPFPLTAEEWDGMMRVLESMKVGLVRDDKGGAV